MNSSSPLILITNDDGISHAGLANLAEAVSAIGEVIVVAPNIDHTSMGRSFLDSPEIGIAVPSMLAPGFSIDGEIYSVIGTPAQVVSYAVLELCKRKPDLCIVGINEGLNIGTTITGSGTVGAALEAEAYGIPSIAISAESDPAEGGAV